MPSLIDYLQAEVPEIHECLAAVSGGASSILMTGAARIHKVCTAAALQKESARPIVLICPDDMEAGRIVRDLGSLTGLEIPVLSERDFTFYSAEGVSRQMEQKRIRILYDMAVRDIPVLAVTVAGLMQRCIPKERLLQAVFEIKPADQISIEAVLERLVRAGFTRAEQVEGRGQFAHRGGILDFFSPAHDKPVRLEFWGDEVDTVSFFDEVTQRRTDAVARAVILPIAESLSGLGDGEGLQKALEKLREKVAKRKSPSEVLLRNLNADLERLESGRSFPAADKYMDLLYEAFTTAADYLPKDALLCALEPGALQERGKRYAWQVREDMKTLLESAVLDGSFAKYILSWEDVCAKLRDSQTVLLQDFMGSAGMEDVYLKPPSRIVTLRAKQLPGFGAGIETAVSDAAHYAGTGFRTIVLAADARRARLLQGALDERGISAYVDPGLERLPKGGECAVTVGTISAGMEFTAGKVVVLTEGQQARQGTPRRKAKQPKNRQKLQSYTDLSPGDLVVHEQHGIGRFVGIFPMDVDGVKKDYVKIAYHGGDILYVPATNLDVVSKYIGSGEDQTARLSRMGGADWKRAKTKAKAAAKELARGLIQLYAERERLEGHAFAPDTVWQTEFEEAFEYDETEDQLTAIAEIKKDMEKRTPMDRLLCGDVGYGKTEVALRGVMKCVMDGLQAAVLVPTTVLAQQHYTTVLARFNGYPVRVEVLSRFRTAAANKKTVEALKRGEVDIVIGTHRLLQKDVSFKRLGLLVVDEEQRFGVTHKERLKELSKNVDVLTLTATPIPRTLNMSLAGIRDMSTIEEPPQDRHPVQTYVLEHDWGILIDAIRREVSRGGQVYYLHNRVDNIQRTAARISEMVEGINVAVAHGRMEQAELGAVMEAMSAGETQVLICTTIIETGIDIPNVNTLIIEDADRFGLAQLHQIRGRVGRSSRHAFAYLTYREGKVLSEVSVKRLEAIREFAEFNSGFKIAMRDLEIRGAGNLLGSEQSGHMISVGYDMYLKILEEAVLEEKGETMEKQVECVADLAIAANIPESYIASPEQRMDIYRRIAFIRAEEASQDMLDELIDRYGDPPDSVINLVNVAQMRGVAGELGISEIAQKEGWLQFTFENFDLERISQVFAHYKGRIKVMAGSVPAVRLKLMGERDVLYQTMDFLNRYGETKTGGNS